MTGTASLTATARVRLAQLRSFSRDRQAARVHLRLAVAQEAENSFRCLDTHFLLGYLVKLLALHVETHLDRIPATAR